MTVSAPRVTLSAALTNRKGRHADLDRTARSRHHPRRGTHQRAPRSRLDPPGLQPLSGRDHLRLAPAVVRARLVVVAELDRGRHGGGHGPDCAPGPDLPAHRDEPLHLLRRPVRRARPAGRLGGRSAPRPRLHGADRVDRRGRDGGRAAATVRSAGGRSGVRPGLRGPRRGDGRGRGVRVPGAAGHVPGPGDRHDGPAGAGRHRLRPALHHLGDPRDRRLSAGRLLADLVPGDGGRGPVRPDRLHHPPRRLHPLHLPGPPLLPPGPARDLARPDPGPAGPPALRHLHGVRGPRGDGLRGPAGDRVPRLVPDPAPAVRHRGLGRQRRSDAVLHGPRPGRDPAARVQGPSHVHGRRGRDGLRLRRPLLLERAGRHDVLRPPAHRDRHAVGSDHADRLRPLPGGVRRGRAAGVQPPVAGRDLLVPRGLEHPGGGVLGGGCGDRAARGVVAVVRGPAAVTDRRGGLQFRVVGAGGRHHVSAAAKGPVRVAFSHLSPSGV